jgi:hypothetical protein
MSGRSPTDVADELETLLWSKKWHAATVDIPLLAHDDQWAEAVLDEMRRRGWDVSGKRHRSRCDCDEHAGEMADSDFYVVRADVKLWQEQVISHLSKWRCPRCGASGTFTLKALHDGPFVEAFEQHARKSAGCYPQSLETEAPVFVGEDQPIGYLKTFGRRARP